MLGDVRSFSAQWQARVFSLWPAYGRTTISWRCCADGEWHTVDFFMHEANQSVYSIRMTRSTSKVQPRTEGNTAITDLYRQRSWFLLNVPTEHRVCFAPENPNKQRELHSDWCKRLHTGQSSIPSCVDTGSRLPFSEFYGYLISPETPRCLSMFMATQFSSVERANLKVESKPPGRAVWTKRGRRGNYIIRQTFSRKMIRQRWNIQDVDRTWLS